MVPNDEEYLYVPSTVEASRTTSATRPQWMGEAKRDKAWCAEHEIQVVEIDPEAQLNGNPTNQLPVLSIPMRHIDFKCTEDANGKCTNKEEKMPISSQRKGFCRNPTRRNESSGSERLPEQITNLFYPCFTPQGESLIASKLKKMRSTSL